jgi:hypothetical protein
VPCLVHKIVTRVALFTRSHPLALVIEVYGRRIDELIDRQNKLHKAISLTNYINGDEIVLNNVYKYYSRHHRKYPIDMTRCRIGFFIADSMTGNSLTAPTVLPGNTYFFQNGIKIRLPDSQIRFKYHHESKPYRADCGHQIGRASTRWAASTSDHAHTLWSTTRNRCSSADVVVDSQVCSRCKLAVCERCAFRSLIKSACLTFHGSICACEG